MPRQAREESGTGIFHVMMRGINHQAIFEDEEDYYQFINILDRMRDTFGHLRNSTLVQYCAFEDKVEEICRPLFSASEGLSGKRPHGKLSRLNRSNESSRLIG